TAATSAARNGSGRKAPAATPAAVPTSTGAIAAGSVGNRAAITHTLIRLGGVSVPLCCICDRPSLLSPHCSQGQSPLPPSLLSDGAHEGRGGEDRPGKAPCDARVPDRAALTRVNPT